MAFLDETGLAHFWNQILARLNKFVPAESGKGLSSNDYTVEEKEKLAGIEVGANKTIVDSTLSATSTNPVQNKVVNTKFNTIQAEVDSKVDSIDGKGLSTEDYTTDEKTKLASIAEGAEVNVQADWNEADTSSDAYIVNKPTIPSKTSDLTNDSGFLTSIPDEYVTETELTAKGYLTSYTETDPTVPAWAKEPTKPTYTAAEVGALPNTYTPPDQTAEQVGADPAGAAASAVSQHNTDATAHNDLRLALQGLSDHINAALDSDDTTLDQMSEVVAYIKSNKNLIDAITTSKVSVADIVNDLVTNMTDKPLSAAQGVALKALIDGIVIPDKLPNPHALTFTGAVTGSYDGSAPVSVEIPSVGGGRTLELIADVTTAEETTMISITEDSDGNAFKVKSWAAYIYIPAHKRDTAKTFYARGAGYGGGMTFTNMLTNKNIALGFFLYPIANYDAQDVLDMGHPLKVQYISSFGGNTADAMSGFDTNISIFQVYTNNTEVLFPAGVRVRLWGVRT